MINNFWFAIVSLLAISCSQAVELPVEHSLDGGITFKRAGFIDGNFKLRDLTFTREELSPADAAQLNALVKADKFYTLRVAGSITSVRASCFAAPASEVQESLQLSTGSGGVPAFINYIVQSPGCQQPFRTTKPHLGSINLEVEVHPPAMGPVIFNLLTQAGVDAAPGEQ
ncbi:hypothetical protein DUNSADRAFT_17236 [Dunaliella salina]|uniref:Lipoprotein n=1 Tax=Dunaliella salina TaxID=3046 RepID=A0ABQ7G232_DUNSA|nr:hypothetical protein DUNSADRAFT_17236 [Dunaliella salina]|eukprot:KAF5828663.1 hypothetical protein DUNSADRAFT_17236 [Dunaliella salina]